MTFSLIAALLGAACVDGTTPDCTKPQSGCFPSDAAAQPDSSDASADADAGPLGDAAVD